MRIPTIRAAAPPDIPTLARLWYERTVVQQQADPRVILAPDAQARWTQAAAGWLESAATTVLVADADARIVGFLVAAMTPNLPGLLPEQIGLIRDFVLDTHAYHAGAGRELVQHARAWFAAHNVEQVQVQVARNFAPEQAFWQALGARKWMETLWMT